MALERFYVLFHVKEHKMVQLLLPNLEHSEMTANLPDDPTKLLTDEQHRDLSAGLVRIAEIRRKAEVSAANLQIA